ncbi:hypothetical protein N657DRAFT_294897 [Parathielavia appendiculata]|uniref:Uncharacterized protein n=1 Tax=Parathielavia appendiculata TaxID=2587402 RepID=A0AAN6U476_9PEZI|nr:hypothetical protein N657DRAFT_294897 [Parathielavia appendiculata]
MSRVVYLREGAPCPSVANACCHGKLRPGHSVVAQGPATMRQCENFIKANRLSRVPPTRENAWATSCGNHNQDLTWTRSNLIAALGGPGSRRPCQSPSQRDVTSIGQAREICFTRPQRASLGGPKPQEQGKAAVQLRALPKFQSLLMNETPPCIIHVLALRCSFNKSRLDISPRKAAYRGVQSVVSCLARPP